MLVEGCDLFAKEPCIYGGLRKSLCIWHIQKHSPTVGDEQKFAKTLMARIARPDLAMWHLRVADSRITGQTAMRVRTAGISRRSMSKNV